MSWIRACIVLALVVSGSLDAQRFRVISSNLWHSGTKGFDYVNHIYPLGHHVTWPGIKSYLKSRIPWGYGIIGMQEVDRWTHRTGGLHVAADLAARMGEGWTYRFGATQSFDGGDAGNAVVTNATVAKLQYWRFAYNANSPSDFGPRQRGAVAMKLDFRGKRLWFVNTHLETKNSFALAQVFQLLGRVKTFDPDTPVIVLGDMNILNGTGGSATEKTYHKVAAAFAAADFVDISYKRATRVPGADKTIAVADGQLDYIFVYDPHKRLKVVRCSAAWVMSWPRIFTDHLALVADFEWN